MTKKRTREEREDQKDDAYKKVYENFSYQAVPASGCPGSPHRYFASSYTAQASTGNSPRIPTMRIHRHANNLCVVTAGDLIPEGTIESVRLHHTEAPPSSAGSKRKHQSKLLRGKEACTLGVVRPDDILCTIRMADQSIVEIPCAVWGTVLEVNSLLKSDCTRLVRDPLFSGYLAVILPTGPFPPPRDEADETKYQGSENKT